MFDEVDSGIGGAVAEIVGRELLPHMMAWLGANFLNAFIAAILAALWILIAAGLSVLAARRLRDASSVISAARSLQSLVELSPARPLVVRSDGGIEADARPIREDKRENNKKRMKSWTLTSKCAVRLP